MSNILGKSALGTTVLKRKIVYIPEWGGEVLVRELTISEKAEIADFNLEKLTQGAAMRSSLGIIRYGWINEDGSHVLTSAEDVKALGQQPESVIVAFINAIAELNGADAETAKKNSTTSRKDGSGSS